MTRPQRQKAGTAVAQHKRAQGCVVAPRSCMATLLKYAPLHTDPLSVTPSRGWSQRSPPPGYAETLGAHHHPGWLPVPHAKEGVQVGVIPDGLDFFNRSGRLQGVGKNLGLGQRQ
eukprot:scaffold50793_cov22-Tisochrysis_lutea.AAC.2